MKGIFMTVKRLLELIDKHGNNFGHADGDEVKKHYGEGFDKVFHEAIRSGYISREGPVGSITLSSSGMREARR